MSRIFLGSQIVNSTQRRESRPHGEGDDGATQSAKETWTGHEGPGMTMQTSLQGIARKASEKPQHRFRNVFGLLSVDSLIWCWQFLKKEAAPGIDRVDYYAYRENLVGNVKALVERLKRGSYKAKLVRRKWIPKGKDKLRPLGIPVTEDKLLQTGVMRILQAIYEQDFLNCSFGYRPKLGPQDAVKELTRGLQFGKYGYVVEADIKGYFDSIDHDWMMRMLEERIDDRPFMRLIRKWLKAGILEEDGKVLHPETGSPQGGIVSPVLSNIYLHYVLDLWFERVIKRSSRGTARLIRYCDDFVGIFQFKEDAEMFYSSLGDRLAKFKLQISPEKTNIVRFSRWDKKGSGSFEFLSFEFCWGKSRAGKDWLKRRTSRKKLRASVANFTAWIRKERHTKIRKLFKTLNAKYRGYWNYYGVIGNYQSLDDFYYQTKRILFKWLNRRSQRRSYDWKAFKQLLEYMQIERPRITERNLVKVIGG